MSWDNYELDRPFYLSLDYCDLKILKYIECLYKNESKEEFEYWIENIFRYLPNAGDQCDGLKNYMKFVTKITQKVLKLGSFYDIIFNYCISLITNKYYEIIYKYNEVVTNNKMICRYIEQFFE
jgi:hypothetical protein